MMLVDEDPLNSYPEAQVEFFEDLTAVRSALESVKDPFFMDSKTTGQIPANFSIYLPAKDFADLRIGIWHLFNRLWL